VRWLVLGELPDHVATAQAGRRAEDLVRKRGFCRVARRAGSEQERMLPPSPFESAVRDRRPGIPRLLR
jgi:hypothetical protein